MARQIESVAQDDLINLMSDDHLAGQWLVAPLPTLQVVWELNDWPIAMLR
jgi:hypothetical protein